MGKVKPGIEPEAACGASQFLHTRKALLISTPRHMGVAASIINRAAPVEIPQIL